MSEQKSDLGAMRTMMAADRTLMAWVRTSLSLLSFGYALYKILLEFQQAGRALPHENTPRSVGLFLITTGIMAIVMGTVEYWSTLRYLRQYQHVQLARPSLIIALLMCAAGLMLLVGTATKLL